MNWNEAFDILLRAMERERRIKLYLTLGIGLVCGALSVLAVFHPTHAPVLLVIGGALLLFNVKLCFELWHERKMESHPLYKLIFVSPKEVVWIYAVKRELVPFGILTSVSGSLVFKTIHREEYQLRVRESDLFVLLKTLPSYFTHCSFGYDMEKSQWYVAHPGLLLTESTDEED